MHLLQRLINHLVDGSDVPPGLVPYLGTPDGQDFIQKLVMWNGVLSSHVLSDVMGDYETPSTSAEPASSTPVYELTEAQQSAETKILAWLKEDPLDNPFFLVKGFAGSGKSWFSGHIQRMLKGNNQKFNFQVFSAAPTHKAAAVSEKFLETEVVTLASLLGVKVQDEGEELSFVLPEVLPVFPRGSLIRIDEASMIPTAYMDYLKMIARRYELRILCFGDPAQLPPVKELRSPVWDLVDAEDEAHKETLFEVKRYSGPILEFASRVRKAVFRKKLRDSFIDVLHSLKSSAELDVYHSLNQAMLDSIGEIADGSCRVVSWRNDAVDSNAAFIRSSLGFTDEYSVGEYYALRRATRDTSGREVGYAEADIRIVSRDLEMGFHHGSYRIPCVRLQVDGAFSGAIRVVAPDCEVFLAEALTKLARIARNTSDRYTRKSAWRSFWELKNSFAILSPSCTLTAHRAQGSQSPHIIVDVKDILSMPNRKVAFRCLYVAVTRATDRLTLIV